MSASSKTDGLYCTAYRVGCGPAKQFLRPPVCKCIHEV